MLALKRFNDLNIFHCNTLFCGKRIFINIFIKYFKRPPLYNQFFDVKFMKTLFERKNALAKNTIFMNKPC